MAHLKNLVGLRQHWRGEGCVSTSPWCRLPRQQWNLTENAVYITWEGIFSSLYWLFFPLQRKQRQRFQVDISKVLGALDGQKRTFCLEPSYRADISLEFCSSTIKKLGSCRTIRAWSAGAAYNFNRWEIIIQGWAGGCAPRLSWLGFDIFHQPAWAVGSYSSGPPAKGTPQI